MTPLEINALAEAVAHGHLRPSALRERADLSEREKRLVIDLAAYILMREASIKRARSGAQRRAQGLLKTLLDARQRYQLRHSGYFMVLGSDGGRYRLYPRSGMVERCERHGRRDYGVTRFCIHDPGRELPDADASVTHMLWLMADEPAFLATANPTDVRTMMWNGEWRRTLNEARRARAAVDQLDRALADMELTEVVAEA